MRYSKKYGFGYRKVLNEDLNNLYSMTKEALRKRLVVLNEEANRRLKTWAKQPENFRRNYLLVTEMQNRITPEGVRRYSTRPGMTKRDIIEEIERRQNILAMHTSTVSGGRAYRQHRRELIIGQISEATGIPESDVTRNPTQLRDIGRLLTRLREDRYLSNVRYNLSSVIGSPEAMKIAFETYMGSNNRNFEEVYHNITNRIDEAQAEYYQRQREMEEEFFRTTGFP